MWGKESTEMWIKENPHTERYVGVTGLIAAILRGLSAPMVLSLPGFPEK